jgi:hypothetical protein
MLQIVCPGVALRAFSNSGHSVCCTMERSRCNNRTKYIPSPKLVSRNSDKGRSRNTDGLDQPSPYDLEDALSVIRTVQCRRKTWPLVERINHSTTDISAGFCRFR